MVQAGVFSMNNVTRLDNIISLSLTSFAYPSYLDMVEQHIWLGRYGVVEYVVQRGDGRQMKKNTGGAESPKWCIQGSDLDINII